MAKYTSADWDDVRKKFRTSIMADISLVSLAQNLDTKEWPHAGEEETPSKYIDFTYDELLILPEIAGKPERADHLIGILKETLAFDDPFGDMVAQVEETAAKENPILKTLARLGIPEAFPLVLANLSEGTRTVCASEGIATIGEFANLGQQMAAKVVLGGDFRAALNALTHGDEEGIGRFLPYRKGATGLHFPEAVGLLAASLPRPDQLGLAKAYGARLSPADAAEARPLGREQIEKHESALRTALMAVFAWFKDGEASVLRHLADGGSYERYFMVLNDPAREAIAVRLVSAHLKGKGGPAASGAASESEKKGGFFSRLFGRG